MDGDDGGWVEGRKEERGRSVGARCGEARRGEARARAAGVRVRELDVSVPGQVMGRWEHECETAAKSTPA